MPQYGVVDGEARQVEIWTPKAELPTIEREELRWQPGGRAGHSGCVWTRCCAPRDGAAEVPPAPPIDDTRRPMIDVHEIDERTFKVTVKDAKTTTHEVTVDPAYHQKLSGGRVPPGTLVEKSFEFLLEREPNTSILQRFDLPVIARYFPEYERTIQRMLG